MGGAADRVLVYLTLWIQKCISVANQASGYSDAKRQLEAQANADQPVPGNEKFVLNSLFDAKPAEAETIKNYFKQLRNECVARMLPVLYPEKGDKNMWWFQFSKKKFMNLTLDK